MTTTQIFSMSSPPNKEKKSIIFLCQKSNNWKTFSKNDFCGPKFWGVGYPPGVVGWRIRRGSVPLPNNDTILAVDAYASMRRSAPQLSRQYLGFMTSLRGVTWHMGVCNRCNFTGQCTYVDYHKKIYVTIAQYLSPQFG